MSEFDDHFALAGGVLVDTFGRDTADPAVVYDPAGDNVTLNNCVIGDEEGDETETKDGRAKRVTRMLDVITDSSHDNYCGTTTIRTNKQITIGGTAYAVRHVAYDGTSGWTEVTLDRITQREKTRPDYRQEKGFR